MDEWTGTGVDEWTGTGVVETATVDVATAEEDDTNSLYMEAIWKKI